MPANGCVVRLCLSLSCRRGRCDIMGRPLVGYTANKVCAPSATCASKWRRQHRAERTYSSALGSSTASLLPAAGLSRRKREEQCKQGRNFSNQPTVEISQAKQDEAQKAKRRQKVVSPLYGFFLARFLFFFPHSRLSSRLHSFLASPRCQLAPPPLLLLCCGVSVLVRMLKIFLCLCAAHFLLLQIKSIKFYSNLI